ncbi:arylesterase [Xylophilus sp. Kf1]|nr:arylesterase [Xylophilus sp. Kf1]
MALAVGLPVTARAAKAGSSAGPQKILVVGDSLSAEYGLARGSGWVALMQKRMAEQNIAATVVNASISGDTTSGGRARLSPLLAEHRPDVVVIELGGNDALRGLPLQGTIDNLTAMVKAAQAIKAKVLLVGIQVPPNYGGDYMQKFSGVFLTVAKKTGCAVAPFLLRGVADVPDAENNFQPDRIHPLASAHPRMLDNVWPELLPLLKR